MSQFKNMTINIMSDKQLDHVCEKLEKMGYRKYYKAKGAVRVDTCASGRYTTALIKGNTK